MTTDRASARRPPGQDVLGSYLDSLHAAQVRFGSAVRPPVVA
jgi:hypothetical protein